jgi:hypothetical protein
MNHDTLNMLVKFICSARKITGPLEANRLAADIEYRQEVFNKIEAEGDAKLHEMLVELREKLALKETIASSSTYKDVPIDFNYYKNSARAQH